MPLENEKNRDGKKSHGKIRGKANRRGVTQRDLERVEFHRHALALIPETGDRRPGIAFYVEGGKKNPAWRFCSCSLSRDKTCPHILKLSQIYKTLNKKIEGGSLQEDFKSSLWYRMAKIMGEDHLPTPETLRIQHIDPGQRLSDQAPVSNDHCDRSLPCLKIVNADGEEVLSYLDGEGSASRLADRLSPAPDGDRVPNRAAILEKLARITLNENERMMLNRGFKTRGLVFEEGLWYRFAYHCYREFGRAGCTFHPAIEERTGTFTVTCNRDEGGEPVLRMIVPRQRVRPLLEAFGELLPNQHQMPIHPIPLKSIFKVTMNTRMDLNLLPLIRLIQENGEERFFERKDFERFRYGDLVYIKELGIMAELERPNRERKFKAPKNMTLKKSQVPVFLEEFGEELRKGPYIVEEKIHSLKIFKAFERLEITPEAIDRDWLWFDVRYSFGNTRISLREILNAKSEGQRFIGTPEGWVDCQSRVMESVSGTFPDRAFENEKDRLKLSRMDLFRLKATSDSPLHIVGDEELVKVVHQILGLKPSGPLPPLKEMRSTLRPYQRLGLEWLIFLFENGFGGLLCDDMGLGKTHQAMALMLILKRHKNLDGPCLVVCPTTVLSHWKNKIQGHVPALRAAEYHGGERDLDEALEGNDVLLTSYGILRRDIERLRVQRFPLVVFDEIQHIKNPQTQAFRAARDLEAGMKIGLTGTPIENTLFDLKALMDMTVPEYLGGDDYFIRRYVQPDPPELDGERRKELARLISPFTLRRLKKTVLKELPKKIEDIMSCRLSEDQVKLYRDAISSRGAGLVKILKEGEEPVPYMHIFALLTLLKQICNHPGLVNGKPETWDQYRSGKWDLFKEIVAETLESGQKAVIFGQFLGMIEMIAQHLEAQGVGFVTLTGASRNRGKIISRFNNDSDCRFYVGSLKAGGTGIDLVAASVVIHYDRWWNAAREDQATDRVHRIGQKRGVHVFKLVTEGTLEEKISAIIEKKRNLMDSVVKEDDPGLLKAFSREELIELLSIPD
jgi:superfamily II DNA or RNA helicase